MPEINDLSTPVAVHTLPPLILHPFSNVEDGCVLIESSRANLMLQGLLPAEGHSSDELDRSLLRGRYAEIRMLFYVGKDLNRWLEQCCEVTRANPELQGLPFTGDSFVPLLTEHVPARVRRKLEAWGVVDFVALFRRALGLHLVFSEPPPFECLSAEFLRQYHRYIDQWFETRMQQQGKVRCNDSQFTFEIYASGEYARLLEQTWKTD
jgi:hypothetical protein